MDFNFMNFSIINSNTFLVLIFKLIIDLSVMFLLFNKIYIKFGNQKSYLFMFGIFNLMIFLVCSLLSNLTLSLGFSFGIFAIFSIMRYRTINIPIKEMTYLFIAISVALINSLYNPTLSLLELIFTNVAIVVFTYFIERIWRNNFEATKIIIYERIDLIKPQNSKEMMEDLKARTGININRFEIGKIDFLKDVAQVKIYFQSDNMTDFNGEKYFDDDDD